MARCYLLSAESLPMFLPFLYPSDRTEAKNGTVKVLGAVTAVPPKGEIAVGALAFVMVGQTAHIQSISVSPDFQQCMIATQMLYDLKNKLPLLDGYMVQTTISSDMENFSVLDRLFTGAGFERENGPTYSVHKLADFKNSAPMVQAANHDSGYFVKLADMPAAALREFSSGLVKRGVLPGPMDWKNFDPELTLFALNRSKDNAVQACSCISREENGVNVEWIYLENPKDGMLLLNAFHKALEECLKLYPEDATCTAVLLNESSEKMMNLLAGKKGETISSYRYVKDLRVIPEGYPKELD